MVFNGKNMGKPSINGGFSIVAPWGKTRWKMLQSCVSVQREKNTVMAQKTVCK